MVYAYSEHYVLPISHDEVVYGKGSVFGKMPGNDWQKYAGVRALFAYQWAHPGKNLTFMGNEIAQYGEWDHDGSIDWDALEWPDHQGVQKLVADLNELYKTSPALWSQDFDPAGFQWLTSDDADHNTLSFVRIGKDGEQMVAVVNFSGEAWSDYQVPLTKGGKWTEVLTTDDEIYGGSGSRRRVSFTRLVRKDHRSGTRRSILEAGTLRKAESYAQLISTTHSDSTHRSGGRRRADTGHCHCPTHHSGRLDGTCGI